MNLQYLLKKKKQEALEKFREITNGGSKESKSEKPVKGDTDLSWDHEGLEPHPKSGEPKPPRGPKPPRVPKTETKKEQISVKICLKCKGNHDEKDCTKFLFKKGKVESMSPQPVKLNQTDKSEVKVKEKWGHMKRDNYVDKDTERWVEEKNAFFQMKKEKQKGDIPDRFDPKGPVRILQRRHYASTLMPGQVPQRLKDSRYTWSQPSYWSAEFKGTQYEKEFGEGYSPKDRKWPQGNGYGRKYGIGEKKGTDRSYKSNGTQSQVYYMTQGPRRNGGYLPTKGSSSGQGGMEGDESRDNKRKFGNSKYEFEDKREEESDTEDSCELEITPKQLSQVVPKGRVLKIKLSKKKPIKITAGAPDGEPDPAQAKVKTIHDPIDRKNGQPLSGLRPGVVVGTEQPKEKKKTPEGVGQTMLGMGKREGPNIPPRRMGGPNGGGNGASSRNGDSHDHGNSSNENGGPGWNGDPPDRRGGGPPRENGNLDGGGGGSDPDDSGDGDDSSSSSASTPPRRRRHRRPKYVYVLRGPTEPPG